MIDNRRPDRDSNDQALSGSGDRKWGQRGTAAATIAARLSLEAIDHAYGDNVSLRDVSLDVEPGEILCLLGASGCGKTTLLRVAAGLEVPTRGRVLINGRCVCDTGSGKFIPPEERGVGLMFQDYALFPHLTLVDNVRFGLAGLPRGQAEREALNALERVGLQTYGHQYPYALSGGEQQRVALARAIAPRPSVILMDEPFSGLDRSLRQSVRDETLAVLRETRATCMIVTHDPDEAMRLGDRIALMRGGRIIQMGTAGTLYRNPVNLHAARFFAEFNEIDGFVKAGYVHTPFGAYAAAGVADSPQVNVGIRVCGVQVADEGPGLAGRVLSHRFLGEVCLLEIAVEGIDLPIKAKVQCKHHHAGDDVMVSLDPHEILVFDHT